MEIALALSGGGSRAMAFHLGCLRALNDREILDRVSVLSTISGGSVLGALYAYRPDLSFSEFEEVARKTLRIGFSKDIVLELLHPEILLPCLYSNFVGRLRRLTRGSLEPPARAVSRTDAFERALAKRLFGEQLLTSKVRDGLEVVIGACDLSSGSAFRFGNKCSGGSRWGQVENNDLPVSLAVAASAAYPLLLPAIDRNVRFIREGISSQHRLILTDGGVFDNLGVACLEPNRTSGISTHAFTPEYIIACNASAGTKSRTPIPWGFLSRVQQTFNVVHRQVQNGAMHQIHAWKDSGKIKGFIMPYLGQNDSRLPNKPPRFVTKEDVENYPTDFSPMTDEWITKLSLRGEQLTRALLQNYIPEL